MTRRALALAGPVLLGLFIGLLGAVLERSPSGQWIERTIARSWVFRARGARPPPAGVVVVSMDEREADLPALARDDRRWSRHLYADLVERLSAAGAVAVVLDVTFESPSDEAADRALEEALRRSERVVLFRRLTRSEDGDTPVPTLPRFLAFARVHAVFPLPKLPGRVEYYWPFFRALEPVGSDGEYALRDLPSLPIAALQLEVLHTVGIERFERSLRAAGHEPEAGGTAGFAPSADLVRAMSALRRQALAGRLEIEAAERALGASSAGQRRAAALVRALFRAFSEPGVLYLNFYGPTRTIATLDHGEVLEAGHGSGAALREVVAGKVVFVGHSGRSAIDQTDGFGTVFTREDGVDRSGVEIAATAYANLLDGSVLEPASPALATSIHVLLGVLVMLLALRAGIVLAVVSTVALGLGYFALSVQAADIAHRLLPLGVPLLVLLPFTLFSGLLYGYLDTRRQRDRYRHGARLLLPETAVRDIESERVERASPEALHGTCMITDVTGYTPLSEALGPERLASLGREYFALLTTLTRRAGGELIDLEGDSMTALWTEAVPTGESGRLAAGAALEIGRAVESFGARHPATPFVTRIGLHSGEVVLGNIGGGRDFRHRVVGDTVNTASRLEGLNKRLGTSILATRAVVNEAEALLVRPLGTFLLKGKSEPLEIVEVLGERASARVGERRLCERFGEALAALEHEVTSSDDGVGRIEYLDEGTPYVLTLVPLHVGAVRVSLGDADGRPLEAARERDALESLRAAMIA